MKAKILVLLFFDDGYEEDMYIARMLRQSNMSATFAITIKNIGNELDKSDLMYLTETGEVMSHGIIHINLVKLLKYGHLDLVCSELKNSKIFLEKLLGTCIKGFAYPYGAYNELLKKLVNKAGYEYARSIDLLNIAPIVHDKYAIPVTMVDYKPTALQLLKSSFKLRSTPNGGLDYFTLKMLKGYAFKYASCTSHVSILKVMLNFLKEVNNYVKRHNRSFTVSLVFHGRCFNHSSLIVFRAILDYIKKNSNTFKTLTLSEYVNILNYLPSR